MTPAEIATAVRDRFGDRILETRTDGRHPFAAVAPGAVPEVCRHLRDALGFDLLHCLSGVDLGSDLQVVYHLESTRTLDRFVLRTTVTRSAPEVGSVEGIWRTADWHERECFDLLGVRFTGHHNLVRILCAEDWEGHPLRKDYRSPDSYHGVRNNVV